MEDTLSRSQIRSEVGDDLLEPLNFSWGKNKDGQLGFNTGHADKSLRPTVPKGLKGYIRQVATARSHTAALNHQGKIYLTGSLLFGKIGIEAQVNKFTSFHLQKQMTKFRVLKVSCGDYHTLALTDTGQIFSWGGTLWDKTGHKGAGVHRIEKLADKHVIDISCGDFHSVALSDNGEVYSWGGGGEHKNKGQLGHGTKNDLPQPERIQFFKQAEVKKIACGEYHTMIMTAEDEIYAFGEGTFGQLGIGRKEDTAVPRLVLFPYDEENDYGEGSKVQQIALGGKHSLFLTTAGRLYSCGYGSQGQLGFGSANIDNYCEPKYVNAFEGIPVLMVAAGANHSLALTVGQNVYACGYNSNGQIGCDVGKLCTNWTHVSSLGGKNVGRIFAGGDQSWAIVDEVNAVVQNYEVPEPVCLAQDEMVSRASDMNRRDHSGMSGAEVLMEISSRYRLQMIFTGVEKSHRLIHFTVKENCVNLKKRLEDYIKFIYENEPKTICYHKISQDSRITDEQNRTMLPNNPKGCSVMVVADLPPEAAKDSARYPIHTDLVVGDMALLAPEELKVGRELPRWNRWVFKFIEMFEDVLDRVRMIELRPKLL